MRKVSRSSRGGSRGAKVRLPSWSRMPPRPATAASQAPPSEAMCTPSRVLCLRSCKSSDRRGRRRSRECSREDVHGLEADLRAAAREPSWEYVFLPDQLPTGAEAETARAVLANEMFFDPEPIFSAVRVPTLLFYGDDDSWTPIEASIDTWRRARSDDVALDQRRRASRTG